MELMIPLSPGDKEPLYQQIYEYIKEEIKHKNLLAGGKLPSTRALAGYLKVSRSTAQMAYDQLLSEGYIEAISCKGYFVSEIEELVETGKREAAPLFSVTENVAEILDFSPGGIDLSSFPFSTWRKISKDTLVDDKKEMFASGHPQGEAPLREAIREYLHSARGVNCNRDQIVLGAGSEYLLLLLSQLLGRERTIAMENPTYKQAYRVFASLGYPVVPVEMDKSGISVEELGKTSSDVAYVMPSHQYPMGIVMPIKRRQELQAWAGEDENRLIIEDDYDSEFRYKGKPIPALQGMDKQEKVIYIGTFSQSIAPAIRIGYMVLPMGLLQKYQENLSFYASTVSRIDQNILYHFIAGGFYERHLNRMRTIYKSKHDTLLLSLKPLEPCFEIRGEFAGLHVLLTHRQGEDESVLVQKAMEQGVKVYGLSSYIIGRREKISSTVILGYANLTEEEIRQGIKLLVEAWMKGR